MKIFVSILSFCAALLLGATAWGQDGTAKLNLYVFQHGNPVAGLQVALDEGQSLQTSPDGSCQAPLSAGRHLLKIAQGEETLLKLDLLTREQEQLLIIVTLQEGRGYPDVRIESSRTGQSNSISGANADINPDAPPGFVSGQVINLEDGQPIAGARIFISGVGKEATTDADGVYALEVPPGSYSLSVIHADFSTKSLAHLRIESDETVTADMELTPSGVELADVVVMAPYIEGSVASIIDQQRTSQAVTEVIGAEQISKAGDSNAAGALRRVTGLTVEQGKFVLVRGLPPRYTKTMWNGSELPSPDPNGRLVPLDLFPTGVLKAVKVQKSFSPDSPGSFGGGLVELETKGYPEENGFSLSVDTGYNSETTGKPGLTYAGSSTDWLGYDDGTRELPGELDEITDSDRQLGPVSITNPDGFSNEELEALGESLPNIYQVDRQSLPPDFGLKGTGGMVFAPSWGKVGFLASFLYDYEWQNKNLLERTFSLNGDELQVADDYFSRESDESVSSGGLLTFGSEIAERHQLTSNTFFINKASDVTEVREGLRSENDQQIREVTLEYSERRLLTQQFSGKHQLSEVQRIDFDWQYMYAQTRKESPDRRFYRYILLDQPVFDGSSLERRYAELQENRESIGLDLSKGFEVNEKLSANVKVGYNSSVRDREADVKRFQLKWKSGSIPADIANLDNPEDIFAPENIGKNMFVVDDLTGANDDSRGDQTIDALYLMSEVNYADFIRLIGGWRKEDSELNVSTFQSSGGGENAVDSSLTTSNTLPAFSAILTLNEQMQLRGSYGKSISRPDFREISTAQFIDPESGDTYVGNPDLQEAEFESYDLRFEWYPSATEYWSAGLFYKEILNAIETVKIPGFNAPNSFQNADQAEVMGVEVGFRKGFEFVGERWENFYLAGNVTLIDSKVILTEDSLYTNTNKERELQGQAPYVLNFTFGYSDEESDITLLFNQIGERIAEVGIQGQPDITLQPTPRIDFVAQHKFENGFKLKFSVKNILDPEVKYLQGDKVQRRYTMGVDVGFQLTKNF